MDPVVKMVVKFFVTLFLLVALFTGVSAVLHAIPGLAIGLLVVISTCVAGYAVTRSVQGA